MLVSQDIHKLLLKVSAAIGVACLTLSALLKANVAESWGNWVVIGVGALAFFLSSMLPDILNWSLARWRWYRRLVLGETWVEGAWLLTTDRPRLPTDPPRLRIGIVAYSYQGSYLSLRTNGHHIEFTERGPAPPDGAPLPPNAVVRDQKLWQRSEPILAQSKLAFLDSSLSYVNFFKYDGEHTTDGTASGWFTCSPRRKWPDQFTANIVVASTREVLYQRGRKLDDRLVKELSTAHPDSWEDILIEHCFQWGESWRDHLKDILPGRAGNDPVAAAGVAG